MQSPAASRFARREPPGRARSNGGERSVARTPADPIIEFTPLEIDGQTYELAWDFGAIAEAEKVTGCNLLQGVAGLLTNGATAGQLLGLFYAALKVAQPDITMLEASALCRIDTIPDVTRAIARAYNASLPEGQKKNENPTDGGGDAAPPAQS